LEKKEKSLSILKAIGAEEGNKRLEKMDQRKIIGRNKRQSSVISYFGESGEQEEIIFQFWNLI
jgi:hypothetical protein